MLTAENRAAAPCIHCALQWAAKAAADGQGVTPEHLHSSVAEQISAAGGRVDYVEVSAVKPHQ